MQFTLEDLPSRNGQAVCDVSHFRFCQFGGQEYWRIGSSRRSNVHVRRLCGGWCMPGIKLMLVTAAASMTCR
ncbi:hypothetical protein O9929_20955 [Vibrio lentus]|nr:hypothetical protein [Vibrio lentus]